MQGRTLLSPAVIRTLLVALALSIGAVPGTVPAALAHHQDQGLDSDQDGAVNFEDPCPYDPTPGCVGETDSDGDKYQRFQDPCDDNPANEQCDHDGDGVPDKYDPCPNLATGHMLGSDTRLPEQDIQACKRTAGEPPPAPAPTDPSIVNSVGAPAPAPRRGLEITKFRLSPGQTLASIFGTGVNFDVACSQRCALSLGFAWRHGVNYAGTTSKTVGPRGARVRVRAPRHRQPVHKTATLGRAAEVTSLADGDATIHGFRNVGTLETTAEAKPNGFVARTPELDLLVQIIATTEVGGASSVRASVTRVAETVQDVAAFVGPGQQRTLALSWQNSARRLSSRCALSAPLPNGGFQGGLLLGFLAKADLCSVARSYSRVARLLLTPKREWKYYRTYTGLVRRKFARDVCDWVVFVGSRKVSFSYRPRRGRCF